MIRFTYAIEAHREMLARRLAQLRALEAANGSEEEEARSRLCNALAQDFAAHRGLLRRTFVRLRRLGAVLPPAELTPALASLADGDTRAADDLLGRIEAGACRAGRASSGRMHAGRDR